ncbi:hypothetical protein P154DRAFT_139800 [Amniculicola lignicola CBS 123094]|uniref:CENP-C homolog n=1 Tax=Amniculicola lignicola CBS 123094 TaxID=1392246 RepID=A0A6A5WLV3_9PLEO|nr:hypothetical protein P154DRAFT_139800 [Amniculicola lignicola CBS 123094]
MAPSKKRDNHQFFEPGVRGRRTGQTLPDKGIRDEHGMEPLSGLFDDSPDKSPPKRTTRRSTGATITTSESMDIQESSVPDAANNIRTSHLLKANRPHLLPPKARSPFKKTALGSSPRRQTSVGPRAQLENTVTSPYRASSHPAVSRRLDFEQDSSLQETPALSGSGQRRERPPRPNVYSLEPSPTRAHSALLDESMMQEEIALEDSTALDLVQEESFAGGVGEDSVAGADGADVTVDMEESEVVVELSRPGKSRKRKSDVIAEEVPASATRSRRKVAVAAHAPIIKKANKTEPPVAKQNGKRGRPKAQPNIVEEETTAMDESEQIDEPVVPKAKGRPKSKALPEKTKEPTSQKMKPFAKPKAISGIGAKERTIEPETEPAGRLVDGLGKPLSKDQISMTSTASRYGRGRQLLSVYREMAPESVARVGKTGRHRLPPINFWMGEQAHYAPDGSLSSIVKNETVVPERTTKKSTGGRPKKRPLAAIDEDEEDDVDMEEWETTDGRFTGTFRDFDGSAETALNTISQDVIGWSTKGIKPSEVPEANFKFEKLGSAVGDWFSWGVMDIDVDKMKRSKNARRMHLVFNVMYGAVEVRVHEEEFTIRKGGIWQVPRGNAYSIRNISGKTTRLFFAQAFEKAAEELD